MVIWNSRFVSGSLFPVLFCITAFVLCNLDLIRTVQLGFVTHLVFRSSCLTRAVLLFLFFVMMMIVDSLEFLRRPSLLFLLSHRSNLQFTFQIEISFPYAAYGTNISTRGHRNSSDLLNENRSYEC